MRIIKGLVPLVLVLAWIGINPSSVHAQKSKPIKTNPFGWLQGLFSTHSPQAPSSPIDIMPAQSGLNNFLPNVQLPANGQIIGRSVFPTPDQMPGAAYLRNFGFVRPIGVPLSVFTVQQQ
jgi:hypothetical protein